MVVEIYHGHNGMSSAIDIKNPLLLKAISECADHYNPRPIVIEADEADIVDTYCNRKTLEAYAADQSKDIVLRRKAKQILNSLDMHDCFKQVIKRPRIDRTYLLGLNIQQCKKELREAILSGQYEYDLNCAVLALFAAVAHKLSNKPYATILNYVHNRHAIRQQIADETGLSIEEVKEALIAVGFGKRAKKANAVAVIMFASKTGKEIIDEFRKASTVIYKAHKEVGVSRSKKLSSLFFQFESEFMREFVYQTGQKCNLPIHDSVILLKPVNIQQNVAKMMLSFTDHMEYFDVTGGLI
jgi:hypothetical protein